MGLIGFEQTRYLNDKKLPLCLSEFQSDLTSNDQNDDSECENILRSIWMDVGIYNESMLNLYDIRLYSQNIMRDWPPTLGQANIFLNEEIIRTSIHATPSSSLQWQECNGNVSSSLEQRYDFHSTLPNLIHLLNSNISVLLFSGQFDMICNHLGTSYLLNSIQQSDWKHIKKFKKSDRNIWVFDEENQTKIGGYVKEFDRLTFVVILGASHMAPMDQPKASRNMFERFISNQNYSGVSQSEHFRHDFDNSASNPEWKSIPEWKSTLLIVVSFFVGFLLAGIFVFIFLKLKIKSYRVLNDQL